MRHKASGVTGTGDGSAVCCSGCCRWAKEKGRELNESAGMEWASAGDDEGMPWHNVAWLLRPAVTHGFTSTMRRPCSVAGRPLKTEQVGYQSPEPSLTTRSDSD